MAKYLIQATYNAEGAKGLIKDGGTKRQAVVKKAIEDLGGKLEAFYFAFGETDCFVIVDVPDVVSGLAITMVVDASAEVHLKTTVLISPEDVDKACHKTVHYTAPGR